MAMQHRLNLASRITSEVELDVLEPCKGGWEGRALTLMINTSAVLPLVAMIFAELARRLIRLGITTSANRSNRFRSSWERYLEGEQSHSNEKPTATIKQNIIIQSELLQKNCRPKNFPTMHHLHHLFLDLSLSGRLSFLAISCHSFHLFQSSIIFPPVRI